MFTFQFLNDKHTSHQNIYKLSKTNIFFSRFERTKGEKTPNISQPKHLSNQGQGDMTLLKEAFSKYMNFKNPILTVI